MSFTDVKREEIKRYILRKIDLNDSRFIEKTMDSFGISVTTAKRYIKDLILANIIEENKESLSGYALVTYKKSFSFNMKNVKDENDIFFDYILPELNGINENARYIWQYSTAEMLNNALEHSMGKRLWIYVARNYLYSEVFIHDDGVGVFNSLCEYMKKNAWENPSKEDALVELMKGKITRDSMNHSGEGIFFTSKMVDSFSLLSDDLILKMGCDQEIEVQKSHLLKYYTALNGIGTIVGLRLENETNRKSMEVFNMYTDVDEGFVKTSILVKEACVKGEPVARSQARRICTRLEEFKEVILDFSGVEFMGQGFSDELFRIFARENPSVILRPIHMNAGVYRMIKHVGRGNLPENVILEDTK